MMKTRRKTKVAAAADAADAERTTQSSEEGHLLIALPDDLDVDTLSMWFPDLALSTPSPDEIIAIYQRVVEQGKEVDRMQRELDETRAEVEKKDVELDQALQDREGMSKELESSLDGEHESVKKLVQERDTLVASQTALQAQVASLTASKTTSSSEVDALKLRVEDIEREKRDLVGVLSRLKEETTHREDEIQTLRSNLKDARHDHQGLEATVRELRSTETSNKFKLDSLTQQLQLAQAEVERTNTELNSKTEEFAKYRRTKHTELATLQASYDTLSQTNASTQASLKALQNAQTSQSHQLSQALTRVQDLTTQLAEQEGRYASEVSGLRRLVGMMEEREKQAKEIVDGIEKEWAAVGDRAERRENDLKKELERERKARQETEKRAERLEIVAERMGRGELPLPGRSTPATPGTPLRTPGPVDPLMDGMLSLSPAVAIASKAQKSGRTFTQVYADYVQLQDDYARKCAEYDHMERTLSSVLLQIEERAPVLSQQRAEYERLQSEASQLASQLSQALADRDTQTSFAQESNQKLMKANQEIELLQTQLNDLGRQVQSLLREIARRNDPTLPPDEDLVSVEPATDTEAVITNHLVLFKSIEGLQEQNQRLLKIIRELGKKMEDAERDYKEKLEAEQGEAIREAHEAMQELAAQLDQQKKHSEGIIQAYMKERETLRALLARSEKAGQMINGESIGIGLANAQNDLAKELAEVQNQFEVYKTETSLDSRRLRDELLILQRENARLNSGIAKANGNLENLNERIHMQQEQYALRTREVDELTKRNGELRDQLTRAEITCGHTTDELTTTNGRLEQLRNESANLRAEKKIWEGVQNRLLEENKSLAAERAQLADLMVNLKKMQGDLELSGDNDRRRIESRLEMIESQAQDLRAQLAQERDAARHSALQKDIELKEIQTRVEKASTDLAKTRELMISAETSKKHLEVRVEDLLRQVKGSEEKLSVYERRPAVSSGVPISVDAESSRELEAEVAELRSALKVAQMDLESARKHIEQFKEISQSSETALADLNATMAEAETRNSAQLARYEFNIKSLEEKLQAAHDQLADATAKYDELQKTFDTQRSTWIADKKQLEDTIVDMSTSEKHQESDRRSRETDVKQLEDRAKSAEDRYSREVLAHAEDIKSMEALRQQLSTLQASSREHLTTAETAKSNLVASEASWQQQRATLDKEISDLQTRCTGLVEQNKLLYQHLESVNSQATRIRQAADASAVTAAEADGTVSDSDPKLAELRSVVAYLRKEKEIVDLQHELGKQEIARLKSQVDHLSQSLNETRVMLSEEREKAIETATSAAQHAELVERINQLNILRESNATLRAECESRTKKTRELEKQLQELSAQLEPAKEQARLAQAEVSAKTTQIQRLEVESRRWQERNAQILSKYDRIDPAEVQALRDEISTLKKQNDDLTKELEAARTQQASAAELEQKQTQIETLQNSIKTHRENAARTIGVYKNRLGEMNTLKSTFTAEKQELVTKIANLESELQASKASASVPAANPGQTALITSLQQERDSLLAEKTSLLAKIKEATASTTNSGTWEVEKAELEKARDDAVEQLKTATDKTTALEETNKSLNLQKDKFQARIAELIKKQNAVSSSQAASNDEIAQKHTQELHKLEEALKAKYNEELEAANAAREVAVKQAASQVPSAALEKVTLDAQVGTEDLPEEQRIQEAIERGRQESSTKVKLKDKMIVKKDKQLKDAEEELRRLRALTGVLPAPSTSNPTSISPAPSGSAAIPKGNIPVTQPAATKAPATNPSLPRKPGVVAARGAAAGRGAARVPPRGGAPPGAGRGITPAGAAAAAAAASASSTAPAAGVSIMGAATKRPRESDATALAEDSNAKRLKPAEAATPAATSAAASTTPAPISKPVTIRRPPPPPAPQP